ncbi:MAG: iron chelate uptake ABC transporter family permease subunit [Planctomycetota bacterium]
MTATNDLLRVLTLQDHNTRIVLLGTVMFGACGGVVGSFMLLRKKALVGDVASHAALPGIALAYLILEALAPGTGKSPPWLLAGAGVGAASGLLCARLLQHIRLIKEDAALGIVLSVFFGFGVVLLTIVQRLPTGSAGLNEFVFGKAAALTAGDVVSIAIASAVILAICLALFKEFSLLCFDESYAAVLGWPVTLLDLLLTALVVAVTVIGMPSVGLLLVVAQLIIPPTAARFWTDRLGPMTIASGVIGATSAAAGILVSAVVPRLAAGAVIVLAGTTAFAVSMIFGTRRGVLWHWLQQRDSHRHIGEIDLLRACFEIVESQELRVESQIHNAVVSPDEHDLTTRPISREALLSTRTWSAARLSQVLASAQRDGLIRLDAENHIRLTSEGARQARRAARNHRLWELYLIHFADLAPSRVDRAADQIEHVLEPELIAQLEALLAQDTTRVQVPVSPHLLREASS